MPTVDHQRLSATFRESATTAKAGHFIAPYHFTQHIGRGQPPILILIDNIYFLPLAWRKFIIEFCRIQRAIETNHHLSVLFASLVETTVSYVHHNREVFVYACEKDTLMAYLEMFLGSPTSLSLISYFSRAERSVFVDDFVECRSVALSKELAAATNATSIPQRLDYSIFFKLPDRGLFQVGNPNQQLKGLITTGLSALRNRYCSTNPPIFLPAYDARKNIAYQSQDDYFRVIGDGCSQRRDVSTLDLLKLYRDTGYRVSGPMEIRMAWFYNDLKPRAYYCNGGDSYFTSLYIQDIANSICNILPSTNPDTRFEVSRVGPVPEGAFLVTYDYESFTSSLAELKYFLFWIAETFRGVTIDVFDPFVGVKTIDLGEYLHEYNKFANTCMAFDGGRFAHVFDHPIFHMGLSGALGIKGNIVFSTTLHGIAIGEISGRPFNDCVVGDDALCYVFAHLFAIFIRFVNFLGSINPNKFARILRYQEDPNFSYAFKFIKRPLSLDATNTPVLGLLDFFPDFASCLFPEGDGFHTVFPGTTHQIRVNSFVRSLCRYSTLVSRYIADSTFDAGIYADDMEWIRVFFVNIYTKLGLDIEGQLPGQVMWDTSVERGTMFIDTFVPPLYTADIFIHGWAEVVFWKYRDQEVSVPYFGRGLAPPLEVQVGTEFISSSDVKGLQLLVDLEYLHKQPMTHLVSFDESYLARLKHYNMVAEKDYEPILSQYTVVHEVSSWYDLFSSHYTGDGQADVLDIESVFSSIF